MPYSTELEKLDAISVNLKSVLRTTSKLLDQVAMMKLQISSTSAANTTTKSTESAQKPSHSNTGSNGTMNRNQEENAMSADLANERGII